MAMPSLHAATCITALLAASLEADMVIHPVFEVQRGCLCHHSLEIPYSSSNPHRIASKCGHSCQKCLADAHGCSHHLHAVKGLLCWPGLPPYLLVGVNIPPPLHTLRHLLSSSSSDFVHLFHAGCDMASMSACLKPSASFLTPVAPRGLSSSALILAATLMACSPHGELGSKSVRLDLAPSSSLAAALAAKTALSSASAAGANRKSPPAPKTGLSPM